MFTFLENLLQILLNLLIYKRLGLKWNYKLLFILCPFGIPDKYSSSNTVDKSENRLKVILCIYTSIPEKSPPSALGNFWGF